MTSSGQMPGSARLFYGCLSVLAAATAAVTVAVGGHPWSACRAASVRTGDAIGRWAVIPASSVCWRSGWLAATTMTAVRANSDTVGHFAPPCVRVSSCASGSAPDPGSAGINAWW
jgi:hypothetical protein